MNPKLTVKERRIYASNDRIKSENAVFREANFELKKKKNMDLQANVTNLIRELEGCKKEKSFGPSAAQAQNDSKNDYTKEEWGKWNGKNIYWKPTQQPTTQPVQQEQ